MTLKEIEKIIDEADLMLEENGGDECYISLKTKARKVFYKLNIRDVLKKSAVLSFYKRDKDSGKITLLEKVYCLTKMVKKKLDDMTDEEIKHIEDEFCVNGRCCGNKCPLWEEGKHACASYFPSWREGYLEYKDKEIEVEEEVEE